MGLETIVLILFRLIMMILLLMNLNINDSDAYGALCWLLYGRPPLRGQFVICNLLIPVRSFT
jgi:hypothetical protein